MLCLFVLLAVYDEPDRKHVEDALEGHLLLLHLLIDGEGGLRAHFQFILYAFVGKFLLQRLDELGHELLPVLFSALELVCNRPVLLRFRMTEVDVLHLALDVVKAKLMG